MTLEHFFCDVEKKEGLNLILVTSKSQKDKVKDIIQNYHSYVPTYRSVGRKIDWLVELDGEIVGMIGLGSSTYPPSKDMLTHLNISKDEYRQQFNTFANNWRYCLTKNIKNLGTRVLKIFRKQSKIEWKKKYNNDLKYIITFVGGGNNGAVYRADNWECVGKTAGLPKHKGVSMKWDSNEQLKLKFVKPTGEDRKLIFMKKL